jgi:PAS domain S-box-containing protein
MPGISGEETRLRAVVETAVDGVILIDGNGVVLTFNPACERLFGYAALDIVGQKVNLLMPDPIDGGHDQYLTNYHRTGEAKIIGIGREVLGRRRDGSTFPMELSVGEAKQEGGSIFVGIIRDITERKRTEEQLVQAQKMEMVGQLSGGIAHDFNNLLTVIIGNADLLGEKLKARPDLRQYCRAILSAGERGSELTRRLLAFSRRQELQPSVIDCNRLVESMQILLHRTLRENIEIGTVLDPKLVRAYADPAQLESAVLNLALNAQDAMPGGGSLSIATSNALLDERYREQNPEVPPGVYVHISVTDNGHGMPADVLKRVFEPFFTTKDVGKGSGLGLSMVYGFIKQSGGHVAIYSEPSLGTTVKLYLPVAKSSAMEQVDARQDTHGADSQQPRGHESILVVEDDGFVRGYAVGALESLGYRVLTAADGHEALDRLGNMSEKIDLIFSDIVMPGLGGWELAQSALGLRPGLKILLTSGYPLETARLQTQRNVKLVVLSKPYRKAELAKMIRETLDETPQ